MVVLPTLYRIFSKLLLHNRVMDIYIKESVRLAHAYQQEGCGKTRTKINDANPHT